MLEHGGRLNAAVRAYGRPREDWLDLSTGIAPRSYPVRLDADAWQRLPEDDDALNATAAAYYGHPAPLPLPGSQAAILWLPRLLPAAPVTVASPAYGEYAPAWRAAGHAVTERPLHEVLAAPVHDGIVMLGRPNNPDGLCADTETLRALAAHCRWLVVDEAFIDAAPAASLAPLAGTALPNLIVLRSLGKFFGLAGARVGFLCAAPTLRDEMAAALGPWALSHPARQAAIQALADTGWQDEQRRWLAAQCQALLTALHTRGFTAIAGGNLFAYLPCREAAALYEHLARQGILVRLFAQPAALRIGLPGNATELQRLCAALDTWRPL